MAVDRDPSAPGFRYADRRAIVSTEDEPGIERLAGAERVDGVIAPGIDWPVAIAARVAERLGLPHPYSPETAALSTSKLRQRERFAEAGVPQPAYEVCSGAEEAAAAIDAAAAGADAVGIADGPSYTQVLVGPEVAKVGELAARLGGGHDAELCKAVLGVDLNGLALAAALGHEIPAPALAPTARAGGGCVRFLVAPPGELRDA